MRSAPCKLQRPYVAVIAEKPKAASRIAQALGQATLCRIGGIPVYYVRFNGQLLVIVSSAGHMFGPTTAVEGLPVTELKWEPLWSFERRSKHLRPYYEVLAKTLPGALTYISACDYDLEGSTICYKIIEAFGDLKRARRAKFSSLTAGELRKAFMNLGPLDVNNAMAGVARAELDWLWGINFSRLLMRAYRMTVGKRLSLSAGRVQTPTLAEAVRRWMGRNSYVPVPSLSLSAELEVDGVKFRARPDGWEPKTRAEAQAIVRDVKERGYMVTASYKSEEESIRPPPPFNLTDLQEEAARIYGLSPYRTQEIAEDLYLSALISYPRTESQRLPSDLDYKGVLTALARQREFSALVSDLLRETGGVLRPVEGPKRDPAHPAIYPTGETPREPLDKYHRAIYELIVRRFMAVFARPLVIARAEAALRDSAGRPWRASGQRVIRRGWTHYYPYVSLEEAQLPQLRIGQRADLVSASVRVVWPASGVRLSRLALLEWMESNDLGTKGTRARIIETLLRRGFLETNGRRAEVTELGYAVYKTLAAAAPELVSVELTRDFERKLELIVDGKLSRDAVVSEAKQYVSDLVRKYSQQIDVIGRRLAELAGAVRPARTCPICGRPASGELCELHELALKELNEKLDMIAERLGLSRSEALRAVANRRSTGVWARETAQYLLRKLK